MEQYLLLNVFTFSSGNSSATRGAERRFKLANNNKAPDIARSTRRRTVPSICSSYRLL